MQKCKNGEGKGKEAPRAYWHELILYPDDTDTAQVKALVAAEVAEWVSIVHDADTEPETGELKRAHEHLLMHFKNARTASAVARQFRLPVERDELKDNGEGAMAYLTHSTEKARKEGKHRYPAEALEGPLREAAAAAADKVSASASEGMQVLEILDWIEGHAEDERIGVAALARWAATAGLWASFRRAGVIFRGCLDEHNARAEAIAEARRVEGTNELANDPLRFAKLKAGLLPMRAVKAVNSWE